MQRWLGSSSIASGLPWQRKRWAQTLPGLSSQEAMDPLEEYPDLDEGVARRMRANRLSAARTKFREVGCGFQCGGHCVLGLLQLVTEHARS